MNMAQPGPRYQALLHLLQTAETLWNASRVFFSRWELSPSQFNILNLLHAQPEGCSQSELSRDLIMHRSNVTGLIDRLEKRGLVRRLNEPEDRRIYRVVLTAPGRKLVAQILPHYYQAAEKVWGDIPERRAARLVEELARIGANAEHVAKGTLSKR
jgi:DNA-binding MarR family transcriptional regulator